MLSSLQNMRAATVKSEQLWLYLWEPLKTGPLILPCERGDGVMKWGNAQEAQEMYIAPYHSEDI